MTAPTARVLLNTIGAIIIAGGVLACSPPPRPGENDAVASAPAGGARLTGTVKLDGLPPASGIIRFDADPQCAALVQGGAGVNDDIRVSRDGGVQNVFVYLKEGVDTTVYAPPSTPAVLDQQHCQYVPRVSGVQVGQTLIIRNSDPLLHTVRADARENARFNVATPVQGIEIKRTWNTPEVMVPIGCDMHPWMHAYVAVLDHPHFTTTDADGRFAMESVPPGAYTLAVWHERFGSQTQDVVISGSAAPAITFTYSASADTSRQ